MLDKKILLENVRMACAENLPQGIEFAWCNTSGNVVRWTDLLELLETCQSFDSVTGDPDAIDYSNKDRLKNV